MALIDPAKFADQFTEAAKRADGQVVEEPQLILKCVDHGLQLLPVCILTRRNGLADTRHPVAQPDIACLTARVAELGEATVLLGDDEPRRCRRGLSRSHSLK